MEHKCYTKQLTHPQITSPRKVFTVLVERHCHDSVSGIEGLLDTITVMNINVNVENTLVVPESQSKTVTTTKEPGKVPQVLPAKAPNQVN